jgi:hypothetical protein
LEQLVEPEQNIVSFLIQTKENPRNTSRGQPNFYKRKADCTSPQETTAQETVKKFTSFRP